MTIRSKWVRTYMMSIARATVLAFALAGCNVVTGSVSKLSSNALEDYLLSYVSVGPSVPADGLSSFIATIALIHSGNLPAVGVTPQLNMLSGMSVSSMNCTATDSSGKSTCSIKATAAGTRHIYVANISFPISFDAIFTAPLLTGSKTVAHLISSASSRGVAPGGYKVESTIGQPMHGALKGTAPGGYEIESSFRASVQYQ